MFHSYAYSYRPSSHQPLPLSMPSSHMLVSFAILSLLPLVAPVDDEHSIASSNKLKIHKMINPQLSYEIKLHGLLLWASAGFLIPLSILIKRISNTHPSPTKPTPIFYTHAITQVLAVLVAAAGGIISIRHFDNSFSNQHQIIGLVFYGAVWLQTVVSILRPARRRRGRNVWFLFHWLVGIATSLLGVINVITGLQAYHKRTSEDVRIWTSIFVIEVCLMLFVYLLQEKWLYLWKQIGNETLQLSDDQKEKPSEAC